MAPDPAEKAEPSQVFLERIWDQFDALHVLRLLLSDKEDYFSEKKVLFAALGAWIVAPQDSSFRKAAIVKSITKELIAIERRGAKKSVNNLVMADVSERLSQPKMREFYSTVYFTIGGLKAITNAPSNSDFNNYYKQHSDKVVTAVEVAKIYHYHAAHLASQDEYRRASLNGVAPLVSQMHKSERLVGGKAIDNIKKQWRSSRKSVSLAYAAYSLVFHKGKTYKNLLDVLKEGGRDFHSPTSVIKKLSGRAYYIEKEILSATYQNEGVGIDLASIGAPEIPFKPSFFDEYERILIADAFRRKNKGGIIKTT